MGRTQITGNNIKDDSVTGNQLREETTVSSLIPFSNAGFASTNVRDAIIEAKSGSQSFSYKKIPVGVTVTIPTNQQMIVFGNVTIDGTLVVDGELCLI